MSTRYWDCACFSPKRDIKFLGFGIYGPYNGNNVIFEVKWKIEGEDSEVYEFDTSEYEINDDGYSYTVDIRKFGCAPVNLESGTSVFVFLKCKEVGDVSYEDRQVFYGYGGYERAYSIFDF